MPRQSSDRDALSVGFVADRAILALNNARGGKLESASKRALERAAEFLDGLSQAGVDISQVSTDRIGALSSFQYAAEAVLTSYQNVEMPDNLRAWFADLARPLRSLAQGQQPDQELVDKAERFLRALSDATFMHLAEQNARRSNSWTLS